MKSLLQIISDNPMDMTYLGIGSYPNLNAEGKLEPKFDQLVPLCFHNRLSYENKTFRCIHFDPLFDQKKEFLEHYFAKWNLINKPYADGYHWVGERVEVYLLPQRLDHVHDYEFLHSFVETILNTKGNLVLQEYTGKELQALNQRLYEDSVEKVKYKRRILVDMTFGTNIGCCTDMIKAQPFYTYNGDFINLHFMDPTEVKQWIGISDKLNKLIQTKYIGESYRILNSYHVDYRRRLEGEKGFHTSNDYNDSSTPEEIMISLQKNLQSTMDVLSICGIVTQNQEDSLHRLFQNYKNNDPYKWYSAVEKLIPRP